MRALSYFTGSDAAWAWTVVLAALGVSIASGALSVFVVSRKVAAIGQGVSHAAFAGLGIAAVLGVAGSGIGLTLVTGVCCVATAILVSWLGDRRGIGDDTAIGVLLVSSMAIGAVCLHAHTRFGVGRPDDVPSVVPGFESILFGSLVEVGIAERNASIGVALLVMLLAWFARRPLLSWAIDDVGARAAGVPTGLVRTALLAAIGVVVVIAVRVTGVVLASALLVLPGAIALRMSERLWTVALLSIGISAGAAAAGLLVSFQFDSPPGASIVLVLALMLGATFLITPRPARDD